MTGWLVGLVMGGLLVAAIAYAMWHTNNGEEP